MRYVGEEPLRRPLADMTAREWCSISGASICKMHDCCPVSTRLACCKSVDLAVEMMHKGDLDAPVPDYVDENVSDKVMWIVQSYVSVVNKMVWRKG